VAAPAAVRAGAGPGPDVAAEAASPGAPGPQEGFSVSLPGGLGKVAAAWPALAARQVAVGGLEVPYGEAVRAAEILLASRTSAIAPVLRAARSPLAGCDYFGAAAPYLERARQAPKTGGIGAAGRHVTKHAFIAAVTAELERARAAELASWQGALATDERYAAAIARDAVTLRQRAHAAGIRSAVRSAVARAVAACAARAGEFTCDEKSACGTGACRFTQPAYRGLDAPAGPGKLIRPANHADAGRPFSEIPAAEQLAARVPWRAGVPVSDCAAA